MYDPNRHFVIVVCNHGGVCQTAVTTAEQSTGVMSPPSLEVWPQRSLYSVGGSWRFSESRDRCHTHLSTLPPSFLCVFLFSFSSQHITVHYYSKPVLVKQIIIVLTHSQRRFTVYMGSCSCSSGPVTVSRSSHDHNREQFLHCMLLWSSYKDAYVNIHTLLDFSCELIVKMNTFYVVF